jgi:hypothetical protein
MVPLALLLLRSGRSEKLAVLLEDWRPLLAQVWAAPEGPEQLRAVVRYLLKVAAETAHEALRRVLDSVAGEQRTEELMRTIGDALIEQGWLKGLDKGRAEGLAEGLARGLVEARAQGVLRILAAHRIPVDERARELILSCKDLNTLDRWFDQALSAASLADLKLGE